MRLYSSYLLRLWCLEEGELRIKLEHVQSGEKVQVETLDEALEWVERRAQGPPTGVAESDEGNETALKVWRNSQPCNR